MEKFLKLYAVLVIFMLLMNSCVQEKTVVIEKPVVVSSSDMTQPETKLPELAWGTTRPEWDKAVRDAVAKSGLKSDVKKPCKKLAADECLVQALSVMAKFESSFKPETKYQESFNDSKGKPVISRGLLQISQESANQSAYKCDIKNAEDLHDPKINLECGVKIAVKWINQDGTFFGGEKLGLGRYWHVGRSSSKSNPKIIQHLEGL